MAVVVDANPPIVLAVDDDRASIVTRQLQTWLQAGEDLHAPTLLPCEVASGLTRLVAAGALPEERVPDAFQSAMAVPITYHPLEEQGPRTVAIALKLGRKSAYDAASVGGLLDETLHPHMARRRCLTCDRIPTSPTLRCQSLSLSRTRAAAPRTESFSPLMPES